MKLSIEQLKNLEIFLSRVQLSGHEVGAFQEIIRSLVDYKKTLEEEK